MKGFLFSCVCIIPKVNLPWGSDIVPRTFLLKCLSLAMYNFVSILLISSTYLISFLVWFQNMVLTFIVSSKIKGFIKFKLTQN